MRRLALAGGFAALAGLAGCSHLVVLHDPLSAAEHNDLGVAYESAGESDLARREYRRALRLEPGLAQAWINLGNTDARVERWDEAARSYRRALAIEPGRADGLNNLAFALLHSRRPGALREAERFARRAVARGGTRDSIYRATLGEVLSARARPTCGGCPAAAPP